MAVLEKHVAPAAKGTALRRPRLGFLGVGWIGRNRLASVARGETAEIVAIADMVDNAVEQAREFCPQAQRVGGLNDLLKLDLDGIVIATPNALHAGQAIAAFEAGLAVFCQKPLARGAAEAREVLRAARQADRLLGVDFCYRHARGMKQICRLISSGALGNIYAASLVFHNSYGPDKAWFYDAKLSGGGCVIDLGTHLVDLALWCLDFPRVAAVSSRLFANGALLQSGEIAVEDFATAHIDLETGVAIDLSCSWKTPLGCDAQIQAAFFGTEGGAVFKNVNGSFYDFAADHYFDRTREFLAAPPDDWSGRALVEWTRRLAVNPSFDVEAERIGTVAAVVDALYGRSTL